MQTAKEKEDEKLRAYVQSVLHMMIHYRSPVREFTPQEADQRIARRFEL